MAAAGASKEALLVMGANLWMVRLALDPVATCQVAAHWLACAHCLISKPMVFPSSRSSRIQGLLLSLVALSLAPVQAGVIGAAPAKPMAQAISVTREAATAVLEKSGTSSCLTGKLTNALLSLSSSCEAMGDRSPICQLANQAAVTTGWSMDFMERTSQELLKLSDTPLATTP